MPPALPQFDANVIQSLALTNPGGLVAIKLNCTGTSAAFNLVWGSPPKSAGRFAVNDFYYLGELPAVESGSATITDVYTAKFGAPVAGQRVFIRSKQNMASRSPGGEYG